MDRSICFKWGALISPINSIFKIPIYLRWKYFRLVNSIKETKLIKLYNGGFYFWGLLDYLLGSSISNYEYIWYFYMGYGCIESYSILVIIWGLS